MPAWLLIVAQLLPMLSSLASTLKGLFASNPPTPGTPGAVIHAAAMESLDGIIDHSDKVAGHVQTMSV